MKIISKFLMLLLLFKFTAANAEPIFHERYYPSGDGPFPTIILLHTSGGYKTIKRKRQVEPYLRLGYAVVTPDYYKKHGISKRTRQSGFFEDREAIDKDLSELVSFIKKDPKIDGNNLFAIGYSAGSFPAIFLASSNLVSAASAHYGVWRPNFGRREMESDEYPVKYFTKSSAPFLAIHAKDDGTQDYFYAENAWGRIRAIGFDIKTETFETGGHPFKDKTVLKRSINITHKFFLENMKR
jgi:dienelactone hydrolase